MPGCEKVPLSETSGSKSISPASSSLLSSSSEESASNEELYNNKKDRNKKEAVSEDGERQRRRKWEMVFIEESSAIMPKGKQLLYTNIIFAICITIRDRWSTFTTQLWKKILFVATMSIKLCGSNTKNRPWGSIIVTDSNANTTN